MQRAFRSQDEETFNKYVQIYFNEYMKWKIELIDKEMTDLVTALTEEAAAVKAY